MRKNLNIKDVMKMWQERDKVSRQGQDQDTEHVRGDDAGQDDDGQAGQEQKEHRDKGLYWKPKNRYSGASNSKEEDPLTPQPTHIPHLPSHSQRQRSEPLSTSVDWRPEKLPSPSLPTLTH